jgi:hypothetical protein
MSSNSIDVESAKSYTLLGFIFYILGALGYLVIIIFFGIFSGWMRGLPDSPDISSNISVVILIFVAVPFALNIGFSVWSWITYNNIGNGKYTEARTATIILGIFGLFLAWLIGGIFLLLAYGKLGDVMRGPQVIQTTTQREGRICTACGRPVKWDAKFCEHCGKDLG